MSYIGNTQQNQSYYPAVDFFSGNGSTTAFTLSRPVYSTPMVQVTIANVPQNPGSAFTINGNTITFTSAPPSGSNNIYVYYTSPNTSVATMPQSPVITGDVTSTGGQYTVGSFNSGYTDGLVQDYTTGTGRFTVGGSDGFGFYNGGPSARSFLFGSDSSGNFSIGTSSVGYADLTVKRQINSASNSTLSLVSGSAGYGRLFFGNTQNAAGEYDGFIQYDQANRLMQFGTAQQERMRIDSNGNLLVGATSLPSANWSNSFQTNRGSGVWPGGFVSTDRGVVVRQIANGSGFMAYFEVNNGATTVGSISNTSTNVAYNTTSDYRLKENIQPMQNALSVVQQLNPVTYTWKADGSDGQGFIAHELQAVVPDCVTGEKDAVDAEGNPVYQGIDTSFLVATLTKAIQELKAEVDDLKAQLEAK